jgi:hypothetical protein
MAADAAKRNSFRAVKNQKIASDFLIFYRSLKFYLPPQAAIQLMRQLQKSSPPEATNNVTCKPHIRNC